ncbi:MULTISPECIES: hypothetical protein [Leifsonia]|uniref:Uncharacterized protein n=1 Tax=Leifsonia virtsii TaxID=3035915 RepID=A0ABT8IY45_9MICO|nr:MULTISPECIES: hypothetical protein [Leifsonia]MDN4597730.1 hypothetical protein [Leifsonia virtsii]NUU08012.1 hypothetical protein [Leifsonia sp. C5G2]
MISAGAAAAHAVTHPKTTRNLLIVAAIIVLVVPVTLVAVPVSLVLAMGTNGFGGGGVCGGSSPSVEAGQNVDGYGPQQLKIAATIITVGQQMIVPPHGQTLALMVAIGESGLRNLDHGDAVDNTTIGVFQQGAGYGTPAERMNPATAAAAFYTRMLHVPDWQTLAPTLVAHAVQINADPNHYAPFWTPAEQVLAALTGASAGACQVPADARAAAAVLVGAIQAKKLNFLEPRYQQQVVNMADGTATPDCTIDPHILQLIVVAVQSFQQVGVSDLNRRCTGMTPGAGTASAHWKGKAVDFYAINGQSLTGADTLSVQLIHALDPYAPHGSSIGQSDCRSRARVTLGVLTNLTSDFPDTCNHQHIQVP